MKFRILTLCVIHALFQVGGHLLASDITHSPRTQEENYTQKIYNKLMQTDEWGFTGLMILVSKNEIQKIKDYLSLFSLHERVALLGSQGVTGLTATHTAISSNSIEGLKALLDSIKEDKEACKEIVYKICDSSGNDLSLARYLHEQYGAPQMEDLIRSYIPGLSAEEEAEITQQYNARVRNKEPNMEIPQDRMDQSIDYEMPDQDPQEIENKHDHLAQYLDDTIQAITSELEAREQYRNAERQDPEAGNRVIPLNQMELEEENRRALIIMIRGTVEIFGLLLKDLAFISY